MRSRIAVFGLLAALTLAACRDDDPQVLTGTLEAGGVQGLRYTTSTQSGTTDAGGAFRYVKGETVYFTIGNLTLGAASCAERITLFDLAGLAPPTVERALRRELDRAARRGRTPFVGAMNRQRLLLALDADSDARNGYDLRGRESELVNATLDFDQNVHEFDQRLNRLSPTLTRNVPYWMPVVLLYRGVGLQMPAREEVRREQVDVYGRHVIWAREHTPEGRCFATRYDQNGDGVWEQQTETSFDSLGRFTREETQSESILLPLRRVSEPSYDARGNLTGIREEYEFGFLSSVVSLTTFTLDAWSREDLRVTEHDFSADGVVDSRMTIDSEYDARGNIHNVTYETDSDADGTVDSREVFTVEYDSRNRPRSQVWEVDNGADGTIDLFQSSTGTWSADDREFVEVSSADFDGDGIAESVDERRYELDARGQVRRVVLTYQFVSDVSVWQEEIFENDSDGRTLVQTSEYHNGNSSPQYRIVTRNQYDDAGNLIHRTAESDQNIDGSIEARASLTASIGVGGELLGAVYEGDVNMIGGMDAATLTITNESFASGVTVLAQKYLGAGGRGAADAGFIGAVL